MQSTEQIKQFEKNNSVPTFDSYSSLAKQIATNPNVGYELSCIDAYPREFNKINEEEFSNVIAVNDPTSDMLLDLKERPITDFYHNNMVPFYKGSVKQNMAGTGVPSGNYVDGNKPGTVNSGFDNSTPYTTQLSTFTGQDSTYLHKREIGPMFSPAEQQTNWVYGTPVIRPEDSRYETILKKDKNYLKPTESIQVGPGLNLDPSIPAAGGFHEFTRILPNNVNNYKANQLPGKVVTGKYFSTGLPTSYPGIGVSHQEAPGVVKNRPESFWEQSRLPTMTTKVGFQTNLDYIKSEYQVDLKPKNPTRDQTSYGLGNLRSNCVNEEVTVGQGPLKAMISQTPARSETFMSFDNNIRSIQDCNSQPIGNPQRASQGFSNVLTNWYVNETDRGTVNPQTILQVGINPQNKGSTFYTYEDVPNTTMKETTQYAYSGNAAREDLGTNFWNSIDVPNTTMKETTQYAYAGNAARQDLGTTFWSSIDVPNTTTKETTQFAYAGNPQQAGLVETNRFMFS